VIVRYNRRANPEPAKLHPQHTLEVAWTVVPIVILVFIGAFSLPVLFKQQKSPRRHQHQGHRLPVVLGLRIHRPRVRVRKLHAGAKEELAEYGYAERRIPAGHRHRRGRADVGKTVVMQVTGRGRDPLLDHPRLRRETGCRARPSGRAVVRVAEKEGVYFGQCSELCGKDHAYMPITVKVVSEEAYDAWLAERRQEQSRATARPPRSSRLAADNA
jgi:cytochrome c oxidase subunit 2